MDIISLFELPTNNNHELIIKKFMFIHSYLKKFRFWLLEKMCHFILGDDYISPIVLSDTYGWSYSKKQIQELIYIFPNIMVVIWLKINNFILIATPPVDCNFLKIKYLRYYKNEKEYQRKILTATRQNILTFKDVVKASSWLMIKKEPYINSSNKSWHMQTSMISKNEHVPNATEIGYALTVYRKIRHLRLLSAIYVRTSTQTPENNQRILVGFFSSFTEEVCVYTCDDSVISNDILISSARYYPS